MLLDIILPGTTWYFRIDWIFALFLGRIRLSMVPVGNCLKASSVGAKTVYGPGPLRVSANPAAFNAAARVLKVPAAAAVLTMSFGGAGFFSRLAQPASAKTQKTINRVRKR